jgi:hypothetical protein
MDFQKYDWISARHFLPARYFLTSRALSAIIAIGDTFYFVIAGSEPGRGLIRNTIVADPVCRDAMNERREVS